MSHENRKRILYAPTWEGFYEDSCYTSLGPMSEKLLDFVVANADRYILDYKPHPLTGNRAKHYRNLSKSFIKKLRSSRACGMVAIPDLHLYDYFKKADVLIADISSVVNDFLYLDRPIILPNPLGLPSFTTRFPISEACYVLHPEPFELEALLRDATGPDTLGEVRRKIRDHIHGVPAGRSLSSFDEALSSIMADVRSRRVPHPAAKVLDDVIDLVAGNFVRRHSDPVALDDPEPVQNSDDSEEE